jgi:hypothetical protein
MRESLTKVDEIMKGYREYDPMRNLVSNLGDMPSFEAIE